MSESEIIDINLHVYKSIEYIKNNIDKKITLDDLCKEVELSKYYFSRIFNKHMGISPYRYILNCKIEAVKKDLRKGIDINTIVNNYEFYDLSHLNKIFSQVYGVTPLMFKELDKIK